MFDVNTMNLYIYHDYLSIPWVHVYSLSLLNTMTIPWVHTYTISSCKRIRILSLRHENNRTMKCCSGSFSTYVRVVSKMLDQHSNIFCCFHLIMPGSQSATSAKSYKSKQQIFKNIQTYQVISWYIQQFQYIYGYIQKHPEVSRNIQTFKDISMYIQNRRFSLWAWSYHKYLHRVTLVKGGSQLRLR